MKITHVITHALCAKIDASFYYAQGYCPSRVAVLVEVRTDEGLIGWGQCAGSPETTPKTVERLYAPRLIGKDPRDWQALWHELGGLEKYRVRS